MKIFKIVRQDLEYQIASMNPPSILLNKNLYEPIQIDFLSCFKLHSKAKITDVLKEGTFGLLGFIASLKFCNILREFKLHNIQFIPLRVAGLSDYFFVFINSDFTHYIDYTKTKFKVVEDFLGEITDLKVNVASTRNGVIEAYRDNCVGKVMVELIPENKFFFMDNLDNSLFNIYRIGHFDKSFYVSEAVKDAMESSQINGIYFSEAKLMEVL
jgi:hypothetical protein